MIPGIGPFSATALVAASGLLHHDAHTPSPGAGLYHDPEPSRSRVCAVFLEVMPHLVQFQHDRFTRGRRLFVVVSGIAADPLEH